MSDLEQKRKDFYFTYDFTSTPWTLNFLRMPTSDGVEFRLSRNIEGCQIAYNDEQMCNRLYMTWSLNEETGAKTIRTYNNLADQAARGYVIEKTIDVREADVTDPDEWAANFLAERSAPSARISVDGVVLYDLTGIEWDETRRGKMARVALPDYHVTISERLLSVKYADAINLPRKITAELSNNLETLSSALAQIQKTAESGVSGASDASDAAAVESHRARASESGLNGGINSLVEKTGVNSLGQQETLYTRISQNETAITLEAGRATEAEGVLTTSVAAVKVTADSVSAEVATARNGQTTLSARFSITDNRISTEVTNLESADAALSTRISQTESSIYAEVANKVDKSSVTITAESITIGTNTLYVDATTIVNRLSGHDITVGTLTAANLTLGGTGYTGHLIGFTGFTRYATFLGTADLSLHHSHGISFAESNGTITATIGGEIDTDGSASFSIAATSAYQTGVAAEWNAAANAITWPAAGTGNAIGIIYPVAGTRGTTSTKAYLLSQGSWSNNKMYVYLRADTAQGSAVARTEVDASGIYSDGWGAAYGKVSAPAYGTGSTMSVGVPSSTVGGTSSMTFTLSCYTNYAYITYGGSNGTVVARVANPVSPASLTTGSATSNGTYYPSSGYDGFSSFTVNVPSTNYTANDLHISNSNGNVRLYLTGGTISRTTSIEVTYIEKRSGGGYNVVVRIDRTGLGAVAFNCVYSGSIS